MKQETLYGEIFLDDAVKMLAHVMTVCAGIILILVVKPHVYSSFPKLQLKIRQVMSTRCFALPAAKCRGVDLRPAMSLALTFTASTSFFTLETSPFRQASNRSLKAPLATLLLLLLLPGTPLPESGVEPGLVPLPSVVVGELALLLVLQLLPQAERAEAGELIAGEVGVTSPSGALPIAAPRGDEVASSLGAGGEPGGVTEREEPRGGVLGCCCC